MPKIKSEIKKAAGKLVSAIQKEWGDELGNDNAEFSQDVMDMAHDLLQAGTSEKMKEVLGPLTVKQYLGEVWVKTHPSVKPAISVLEELINKRR